MPIPQIHLHIPGYPCLGATRKLKSARARAVRAQHWERQRAAGLDFISVGDFAFHDHVASHLQLFGCEPARVGFADGAHTQAADGAGHTLDIRQWFDTNYHYLVPEFSPETRFALAGERLLAEVAEARSLGHPLKVVLLGPLTFLWLGKEKTQTAAAPFERLSLLDQLLPAYCALLDQLKRAGANWVQLDEPILGLDLPAAWRNAFERSYWQLNQAGLPILLATYFSPLKENLGLACRLPVAGLHVDGVRAAHELTSVCDWLARHKVLSVGIVDARNSWRTDLDAALDTLRPLLEKRGALWLAPSCSLPHAPFSLEAETGLEPDIKSWRAFATEKLAELALLKSALQDERDANASVHAALAAA